MIERVILSAGAMLIFSVSFQIDQMPEGIRHRKKMDYMGADGKGCVGSGRGLIGSLGLVPAKGGKVA